MPERREGRVQVHFTPFRGPGVALCNEKKPETVPEWTGQ